jgi:4-amino-4-deoxy-L-arabinose transferase-like glycosyltransferase
MEGKGYIVDSDADLTDKHPRIIGEPALFKAPLYQYLLAGIFSISGLSFVLFFPLQSLLGGALSVLVAKIGIRTFSEDTRVGLFAGLAAAGHPVLVNTAAQPYNETVFFFLFFLSIWLFLSWLASPSWWRAVVFGLTAGLTILTRESMVLPFAIMTLLGVFYRWRQGRSQAIGGGLMVAAAIMTVAPWTLHNYRQFGVVLPVSSISGTSIGIGNNECVTAGSLFTPFDGDIACIPLNAKREALLREMPREPKTVWNDRAYGRLGQDFIIQHPGDYLRLSFRRAWTTFLPYHPRQGLSGVKALIVVLYFIVVIVMGLVSMLFSIFKGQTREARVLMWVALTTYVPLVAIYVSADLRYRVGTDLLLACFAGWGYTVLVPHILRRFQSDAGSVTFNGN